MKKILLIVLVLALLAYSAAATQFFLKEIMYEGETKQYTSGTYVYTIELTGVFDRQAKAQFKVNGESTDALGEDESDKLSDGAVIQVRDVLPQESGDGKDMVQFNFFPASHPEATAQPAASPTTTQPTATQTKTAPATTTTATKQASAAQQQNDTQKKVSTVDLTKTMQKKSVWMRIKDWFKNLFD
jgi:hypothetical protein